MSIYQNWKKIKIAAYYGYFYQLFSLLPLHKDPHRRAVWRCGGHYANFNFCETVPLDKE